MDEILTVAKARSAPPCTLVIFGASGDLARRKLLPALYNLCQTDRSIDSRTVVIGFARSVMTPDQFRSMAHDAVKQYSRAPVDEPSWREFALNLDYVSGLDRPDGFANLRKRLEEIEKERSLPPNRIYYLSIPPQAFGDAVVGLHEAGLIHAQNDPHFTRVVIEKPIGHDLLSAYEISRTLRRVFAESQIFRIDHYLGKETVQNLLVLRFANNIFEQVWNNRQIDHVQITVAESEGLGTRAAYYDKAGALRDMVQNHMLQLLCHIAMEPPVSLDASAVRSAKLDVLRALRPIKPGEAGNVSVRARYAGGVVDGHPVRGYLEEPGAASDSRTETFVALRMFVDNWRWSGIPFFLRTGKRLARRASSIFVQFKEVPTILFNRDHQLKADWLVLRLQPDEGFSFEVLAKQPGLDVAIRPVKMNLSYSNEFDGASSPDAYERLLLDVMIGDHTLFISDKYLQLSWQAIQGVLDEWRDNPGIPMDVYPAGGWGPESADRLIRAFNREWRNP